jgi:thioredoxin-like negative regulator of GroEL
VAPGAENRLAVSGEDHASTVNARIGLAMTQLSTGHRDAAAELLTPALGLLRRRHGARHPLTRFCSGLLDDSRVP